MSYSALWSFIFLTYNVFLLYSTSASLYNHTPRLSFRNIPFPNSFQLFLPEPPTYSFIYSFYYYSLKLQALQILSNLSTFFLSTQLFSDRLYIAYNFYCLPISLSSHTSDRTLTLDKLKCHLSSCHQTLKSNKTWLTVTLKLVVTSLNWTQVAVLSFLSSVWSFFSTRLPQIFHNLLKPPISQTFPVYFQAVEFTYYKSTYFHTHFFFISSSWNWGVLHLI